MEDPHSNRLPRQFWLVAGCFLVSGFAALLYETVWLRQFAILLGTSEQALAVVLASYMGGLAIGSLVASRVVDRVRRPLLTYGMLEFGIAASALFVPVGLTLARGVQSSLFGGLDYLPSAGTPTQVLFCLGTAFSLILVPTALMGATLPILARHVVGRDEELGPRIGLLYAINTAGAVAGTLVAAFFCLPRFGLGQTTWIGAICNLLVFGLVLLAVRGTSDIKEAQVANRQSDPEIEPDRDTGPAKDRTGKKRRRQRQSDKRPGKTSEEKLTPAEPAYRWILLFAALSGGVSFCYEIIFTRMLGHMLGGSVFAFATMLAGFLLGIAVGGGIAARLATTRERSAIAFVWAQAGAAVCTVIAFHLVDRMSGFQWQGWGGVSNWPVQIIASIIVLLPTATCVGATFPLAIRVYAKDETEAARSAARVYGWNVVGAIVGSLATGAVLLPLLQYHYATVLAVLCNLLIAGLVIAVMRIPRIHLSAVAVAFAILCLALPKQPDHVLRVSAVSGQLTPGEIIFNHVGQSATVTVLYDKGHINFQTNGLPESTISAIGSGNRHRNTGVWLSALPPLIRPASESMLIIGLGGGVAAEYVAPSIKEIDVIELEPAVVTANERVKTLRDHDPLADSRVNIVINDGRNALALTSKRYDVIVSQPSHPWTAGASHLYTREFNQLAHDHLKPGGVFLQWMNAEFVDPELVGSMSATLLDVFSHVRLYQPIRGTFMFVASDQPIAPEQVAATGSLTRCEIAEIDREYYQQLGVVTPTHLLAMLTVDEQALRQLSADAELITDERNLLAMRAPKLMQRIRSQQTEEFVAEKSPCAQGIDRMRSLCPSLDIVSFGQRMVRREDDESVTKYLLPQVDDGETKETLEYAVARVTVTASQRREKLAECLRQFPESGHFAFLELIDCAFSADPRIDATETARLLGLLTAEHRMVVGLIESMKASDFAALREADPKLAAIPVDDVAFEMAVRLRIPWRLEAPPAERVARGKEALKIIDSTAPFSNPSGLAYFRVLAAMNANQPLIALGTATREANAIILNLAENKPPEPAAVANLQRIYAMITTSAAMQNVPKWRYQETVMLVAGVLQQAAVN